MTERILTQEYLKEILDYDPETGIVTKKARPAHHFSITQEAAEHTCNKWNSRYAGERAGCLTITGAGKSYLRISVDYNSYMLHCLIWIYMTGKERKGDIDHIDGNGLNNRWLNLREVSRSVNMQNSRRSKANSSGCTGVYWSKAAEKWQAHINLSKGYKYLGIYIDWFDAVSARKSAENKYGFHPNHGSIRPL